MKSRIVAKLEKDRRTLEDGEYCNFDLALTLIID